MTTIAGEKHEALINALRALVQTIKDMRPHSDDSLLSWHEQEADSWLAFAESHHDDEELRSLKEEVVARFYDRYNVRIEPKELDEKRLTAFEKVISVLGSTC